jgi:hypothetical protein
VTWNIASHASSNCPTIYGALQFPTKEAEVDHYFHIYYRIVKYESGKKRERIVKRDRRVKRDESAVLLTPDSAEEVALSSIDSSDENFLPISR